jgi:hypothetical protein
MKAYRIMILALLNIFLLMGIAPTVFGVDYVMDQGATTSAYLGALLTSGDCMSCLQGKTVDLYHIATEHAQMPSNWCVEKGRPANEISFRHPYDVMCPGVKDWRSVYQLKMTLDDEHRVKDIVFYKNSVPVSTIPAGLWDFALQKLDAR